MLVFGRLLDRQLLNIEYLRRLRLDENYRGRGIHRRDDEYGDARNYHHTGRDGDYQCEMPAEYVPVLAQRGLLLRRCHGRSAA